MTPILVREAAASDSAAIAVVSASAIATLREIYRPKSVGAPPIPPTPPTTCLIAVREGSIVGTVRYHFEIDRVHLIALFVHESARKQGVARAIVEYTAGVATRARARCLSLFTIRETGNVSAFEKLGFRVVNETVDSFAESDRFPVLHEAYMERSVG